MPAKVKEGISKEDAEKLKKSWKRPAARFRSSTPVPPHDSAKWRTGTAAGSAALGRARVEIRLTWTWFPKLGCLSVVPREGVRRTAGRPLLCRAVSLPRAMRRRAAGLIPLPLSALRFDQPFPINRFRSVSRSNPTPWLRRHNDASPQEIADLRQRRGHHDTPT